MASNFEEKIISFGREHDVGDTSCYFQTCEDGDLLVTVEYNGYIRNAITFALTPEELIMLKELLK